MRVFESHIYTSMLITVPDKYNMALPLKTMLDRKLFAVEILSIISVQNAACLTLSALLSGCKI
jgi:hypothetical protein